MSKPPKPTVTMVRIDKISFELSKQARVNPDLTKIDEYAAALEAGDILPPIDLYREELSGNVVYAIGDGQTRVKAHLKIGRELIDAYVHEGGAKAALLHAVRANTSKQHGVVRTQADGRNAIRLYLLEGDWYTHSDREVGRACESDHKTVASVRAKMVAAKEIPEVTERVGADGKTRQLGNSPVEEKEEYLPQLDLGPVSKPPTKGPPPKCEREGCSRHAYATGIYCSAHIPKEDTFKPLTKLLSDLADSISDRGWTYEIEIPKQKKPCQVIEACTLLPSAPAKLQRERDDEGGMRFLFWSADLDQHLCTFVARPPKQAPAPSPQSSFLGDSPVAPPKASEPEKSAGVESSTPAKTNGSWQHYNTPPELCELLRTVAPIGLDPCHNSGSFMKARVTFDEAQNGLDEAHDWSAIAKGELIPVNCPWGNVGPWVDRIYKEAAKPYTQLILIVSSGSTSSKWWQKATQSCSVRVELSERVPYYKDGVADPNPRDSTVLFYWGPLASRFAAVFAPHGAVLRVAPESFYEAEAAKLRHEELTSKQGELPILEVPPGTEGERPYQGLEFFKCDGCGAKCAGGRPLKNKLCEECDPESEDYKPTAHEAPTEASDPGTWIARALSQLRACTTREEFDEKHKSIMAKASDEEVLSIVEEVTELRAKLPSAANVKPKDLAKSTERTDDVFRESLVREQKRRKSPYSPKNPRCTKPGCKNSGETIDGACYPHGERPLRDILVWLRETWLPPGWNLTIGGKNEKEVLVSTTQEMLSVVSTILPRTVSCRTNRLSERFAHFFFVDVEENAEACFLSAAPKEEAGGNPWIVYYREWFRESDKNHDWLWNHFRKQASSEEVAALEIELAPKKTSHTPPRPQLITIQICVQSSLSPKGKKELHHILGKSRPINAHLRQYLLTPKEVEQVEAAEDRACLFFDTVNVGEYRVCVKCGLVVDDADRRCALRGAPVPFVEHEGAIYCTEHDPNITPLDRDLAQLKAAKTNEDSLAMYDNLLHRYIRDSKATQAIMNTRQAWLKAQTPAPVLTQEEPSPKGKTKMCPDCGKKFTVDEFDKHRLTHIKKAPAPKRIKGKNEEKKPAKKAGRR